MMNSAIVITLTIACSNGVWANTIPTTVPPTTVTPTTVPTTVPQVCYVNGIPLAVGQTYEDKHDGNDLCKIYVCRNPPNADSHTNCYDSSIDKCVTDGFQIIGDIIRMCTGYEWMEIGCIPEETQPTPPTPPPQPECTWNGAQYPVGDIPNSGGCFCDDYGHVACP